MTRAGTANVCALAFVVFIGASCSRTQPPTAWEAFPVATDAEFTGLWFADSLHGFVAGGGFATPGGILGETHDGGRTWSMESGIVPHAGDGFALHRMFFADARRGWIVADGGVVLLTDDAGGTWRRATHEGIPGVALFDLQFLAGGRRGWAIGPSHIVRSDDAGETWVTMARNEAENGYLSGHALHFLDRDHGFLVGHSGAIRRSDDGGSTWAPVAWPARDGEHPTLWDVTFVDASNGWIVGDAGTILRTRDGGATWMRQEAGVPIERVPRKGEAPRPREVVPELETPPDRLCLFAVQFLDSSHGVAIGAYADVAESVILRTRDGGSNWRVEHVQPGEILRTLFVLDAEHAWAAGDRARTTSQVVLRFTGTSD